MLSEVHGGASAHGTGRDGWRTADGVRMRMGGTARDGRAAGLRVVLDGGGWVVLGWMGMMR
jgi:hypothetical protein